MRQGRLGDQPRAQHEGTGPWTCNGPQSCGCVYEALVLGCDNRQLPSAVSNASECGCVYEGLVLGCDNRQSRVPSARDTEWSVES